MALQNNPTFGQASDWSSAFGGTHIGVYLLYGHELWLELHHAEHPQPEPLAGMHSSGLQR
eukprot:1317066-Prorocentrum_lima.AAC.1